MVTKMCTSTYGTVLTCIRMNTVREGKKNSTDLNAISEVKKCFVLLYICTYLTVRIHNEGG